MKALIRDRYGPPDVLEVRDIERPAPTEREVLVRVHATSINDWDWQMLQRPMLPLGFNSPRVRILGSDIAGRVAVVGSGVQRFTVGDEVYGDLSRFGSGGWGGFAEYVCAPEGALVRKPLRMAFEQAAALPQAGQLAVQGLFAVGPLRSGQKILINGAGGGVGSGNSAAFAALLCAKRFLSQGAMKYPAPKSSQSAFSSPVSKTCHTLHKLQCRELPDENAAESITRHKVKLCRHPNQSEP